MINIYAREEYQYKQNAPDIYAKYYYYYYTGLDQSFRIADHIFSSPSGTNPGGYHCKGPENPLQV